MHDHPPWIGSLGSTSYHSALLDWPLSLRPLLSAQLDRPLGPTHSNRLLSTRGPRLGPHGAAPRSSLPRIGQLGPRSRVSGPTDQVPRIRSHRSGPTDQVPQIGPHASIPMDLPAQIVPWDCPTLFGPHGSPLALASSTWPPCIGSLGPALSDQPRRIGPLSTTLSAWPSRIIPLVDWPPWLGPPSARRFRLSALCSAFSARPPSSARPPRHGLLGTAPRLSPLGSDP